MLLSALILGEAIVSPATRSDPASAPAPAEISILAGLGLWIGLLSATASVEMHYAAVYAAAALLPFLAFPRRAAALFQRLGRTLVEPGPALAPTERGWVALLLTLLVLHLFVVAKPEAGYDAMAMHLQFCQLIAEHHRWNFDVERYAWSVMPLGADWAFASAYLLGGAAAARLVNLCFAAIAARLLYRLVRRHAGEQAALASLCLVVSMPLAFLVTGSLLAESLWTAYLLGTLLVTLQSLRDPPGQKLTAFAMLAAGAMQSKATSILWLAPLVAVIAIAIWRQRSYRQFDRRTLVLLIAAAVIGAWPYANAWVRTGNPVFPFMNAWFRSPLFDASASFYNPLYRTPLSLGSIYDVVLNSGRFIEGYDGAAGLQWLLVLPLVVVALVRFRSPEHWLCLALATLFFVAVYTQQSYLRYLLPAFVLLMIAGGWALNDFTTRARGRVCLLLVAGALCLFNDRFMYAAHWPNTRLCPGCAFQEETRKKYLAHYAPDRVIGGYLNYNLPHARVGFFMLNAPGPSGYVGYSRSANWHDVSMFGALLRAQSADDVLALARRYRLTHAVFVETGLSAEQSAISGFQQRYTMPIWRFGGRTVAMIQPG